MSSGRVIPAEQHPETRQRFDQLVEAFVGIVDPEVMAAFLRDLCTEQELDAMGQRLQIARLVVEGVSYHEISSRIGASTATVTRVAHWLRRGEGGYRYVVGGEIS